LKSVIPLGFPSILNVEPTNRCNLACRMCPRSFSKRPITDLDWNHFKKIVEEMKRRGPILKVFLQKDGEPLLHPRIVEMVEMLSRAGVARTISIITNGTLLSEELFSELARAGLHDLIVSMDAIDEQTYLDLKGVAVFARVVKNVEKAVDHKRKNGLKFPRIKARMVARRGHENDIELFRQKWSGKADSVDITPFHTWMGSVKDESGYEKCARYPCSLLWYTGVINSDGAFSPCCIDYNCDGVVGNIIGNSITDLWNGREMNRLRRLHLFGRYEKTKICGPCEYWLIKENLGNWLRRKYNINR